MHLTMLLPTFLPTPLHTATGTKRITAKHLVINANLAKRPSREATSCADTSRSPTEPQVPVAVAAAIAGQRGAILVDLEVVMQPWLLLPRLAMQQTYLDRHLPTAALWAP